MIKKMTDKDLWKEFNRLNDRFFGGRIKLNAIRFATKLPFNASGVYSMTKNRILISSNLKTFWTTVSLTLLHEMAHADLDARGYLGYLEDGGHGSLFQVELDRLYKAGAYDGLL
jgi:hypothetical protein